jgi:hypothetical protein
MFWQTLPRNRAHHAPLLTLAALLGLCLDGSLRAEQTIPYPPVPPTKLWVSMLRGSDATGTGTSANPWATITKALSMANPGSGHAVIMVMPGVYDEFSGETLPFEMKANVSIQGTGAVETILRSADEGTIVVRFRATTAGAFDNVFIDGVTISHAPALPNGTGIRIENSVGHPTLPDAKFPANPTISNCFITDHSLEGIDIVSGPGGDLAHDIGSGTLHGNLTGFIAHQPKILFCTFRFNQTGVENTTSVQLASSFPVPNRFVGVNQPGLLNCLFVDQSFFGNPTDDLSGVDAIQTTVVVGSSGVQSNAFERTNTIAGAPLTWTTGPSPTFAPNLPVSAVNLANTKLSTNNRLFVGTFVFGATGAGAQQGNQDLRLNPALHLIADTLIDVGLDAGSQWTWTNGTVGRELLDSKGFSSDWDCDGFGNPRMVNYTGQSTVIPDIGADEVDSLVIGGFNGVLVGNLSGKRFTSPLSWPMQVWFNPNITSTSWQFTQITTPPTPLYLLSVKSMVPNLRSPGTANPANPGGTIVGDRYLDASFVSFQLTGLPSAGVPMPLAQPTGAARDFYNNQLSMPGLPSSGLHLLSNLQTFEN